MNSIAKRYNNFVPLCLYAFATLKYKTKPKQSQTKPIFRRSIFDFGQKTGISDKFRTTFLCKTKPIFMDKTLIISIN